MSACAVGGTEMALHLLGLDSLGFEETRVEKLN